jgi:phage FluMu protein Com
MDMPIRFHCKRCEQLLGIASRKVGSEIECPKCGFVQTVPSEEAAAVATALRSTRGNSVSIDAEEGFTVYDDAPEPVEIAPDARRGKTPVSPPAPPAASPVSTSGGPEPSAESPPVASPRGMILFPRRMLYVQGVLVSLLALAFFAAGYFVGRGNATLELAMEHEAALRERTLVEGRLVYRPEPHRLAGDKRAVIIAVPSGTPPETPIPIHGIRPQDPEPPGTLRSLRLLEELGGAYTRANADGRFDMIVPDQGEYYILIISRNAARPQGTDPDEADLMEIGRYFTMPERLISRYQYRWGKHQVHSGLLPIEVDFGE